MQGLSPSICKNGNKAAHAVKFRPSNMSGNSKSPAIKNKPKKLNGRSTPGQLLGYVLAACAAAIAIVIYCSSTSKRPVTAAAAAEPEPLDVFAVAKAEFEKKFAAATNKTTVKGYFTRMVSNCVTLISRNPASTTVWSGCTKDN